MSLFHFSMQQLAGVLAPPCDLHYFIAAWLRHHFYLPADHSLQLHQRLVEDLSLDCLARIELVGDAETYYGVLLPDAQIAGLATVQDLEDALTQQLAHLAA